MISWPSALLVAGPSRWRRRTESTLLYFTIWVGASLNEFRYCRPASELLRQLHRQSYEGILPRRLRNRQLYRFDQRRITIAP